MKLFVALFALLASAAAFQIPAAVPVRAPAAARATGTRAHHSKAQEKEGLSAFRPRAIRSRSKRSKSQQSDVRMCTRVLTPQCRLPS